LIKINLIPPEYLENKYWFIPDLIVIIGVYLSCLQISNYILAIEENETLALVEQKEDLESKLKDLKKDITHYKSLIQRKNTILNKINSIKSISSSSSDKIIPLLALEYVHDSLPYGVWLTYLNLDDKNKEISLVGGSFDSLLIAEFISNLKSSQYDMQTNNKSTKPPIYFNKVFLDRVTNTGNYAYSQGESTSSAPTTTSQTKSTDHWGDSISFFPDVSSKPIFNLQLSYSNKIY
jgi:hypothetical protein